MQLIFKLKKYYYALVNVLVFYIHDPKKSSQQQYGLDTIIILVLQMRNLRFRKCKDQNFTAGILVYLTLNISLSPPDTKGTVEDTIFFILFRLTCSAALWGGGRDAANR